MITTATILSGTIIVHGITVKAKAGIMEASTRTGPMIRLEQAISRTTAAGRNAVTLETIAWCHMETVKVSLFNFK